MSNLAATSKSINFLATHWSKEEDDFIMENYKKLNNQQLSSILNRSVVAIRKRRLFLNIPSSNAFTKEELIFLKENHDSLTFEQISQELNRPISSVKKQLYLMTGTGSKLRKELSTKTTPLSQFLGISRDRITAFIREKNLPTEKQKNSTGSNRSHHHTIYLPAFFEWLEKKYKDLGIDFNKIDISVYPDYPYPEWFLLEYNANNSYSRYLNWSKDEDAYIKKYYKVESDEQIAKKLNKRPIDIKRRRLKLDQPLIRHWTEEEYTFLKEHAGEYTLHTLSRKLNRSVISVKRKVLDMFGTSSTLKINGLYRTTYFSKMLGCPSDRISYWVKNKGLPAIKTRLKKHRYSPKERKQNFFYSIDLEDFYNWLHKNYTEVTIDFSLVNIDYAISAPTWFRDEYHKKNRYNNQNLWSLEDEAKLFYYLNSTALTKKEISIKMNRSLNSINNKAYLISKKYLSDKGYRQKIQNCKVITI